MPALANSQHEAFAQARFGGMSVMEAYRAAGYEGAAPQTASKVSQHRDVRARLMELHNAAATVVTYERMDLIRDLVTIIKASPDEATEDHPLCEVRTGRQGKYHRFPSKMSALSRLVKIMGWDEPGDDSEEDEGEPPRDTLREWLFRERNRHQLARIRNADPLDPDAADEWHEPTEPADGETQATRLSAAPCAPLSPKQEAFAQARFAGMGVQQAYQAAGYGSNCPQRASRVNRHPAVKARLAALRKAAEDALPYKKHEAINDLIAIIHASPAEAAPDHPLCETRLGNDGPCYRFPCKLVAIMLLIRLMRWNKPAKVKWLAPVRDTLREFVARAMGREGRGSRVE
jgi:hypothetical protein